MKKNKVVGVVLLILISFICYFSISLFSNKEVFSGYTQLKNPNSSCISCHTPMKGFSASHTPAKITCISCHLGNNNVTEKEASHKNMLSVPGNLSNVSKTCTKCHPGIDTRVKNSIMNTMSGIISVDKYVFGENINLDSLFSIHHLKNNTKAEKHLRNKCASCHIGNEKIHPNPITEKTRGGGCTACHLNYSDEGKKAHKRYLDSDKINMPKIHPSLSLKVTDNHCFGCHSRSGRIATNYEGWHETVFKDTLQNNDNYRVLEDKRVFEKQQSDIHHTNGLSCIDCHDSNDVMGDGTRYAHQESAVNTRCTDCHFSSNSATIPYANLAADEKRIIRLKELDTVYDFLFSKLSNKALLNVIRKNGQNFLITKHTNKELLLSQPAKNCTNNTHKNVSCSTCHTSWAPQCISCHTSFNIEKDGFDLLDKKFVIGSWKEKGAGFLAEYPTLGIVENGDKKTIKTFAPGMIMHLKTGTKQANFHRLFAPISAHTIASKGKSCIECHNNPVALGYGRGKLFFTRKGVWKFTPNYPIEKDGLPKDAWIPFLKENRFAKTTRTNARPFTVKEQQKILRVGACLTCHKKDVKLQNGMLANFGNVIKNRSKECVLYEF